jgi:hypothetical protein
VINNIRVAKFEDSGIQVSWKTEDDKDVALCNVLVNNGGICKTVGVDPKNTSATIKGLSVNKTYEVQVKILNSSGWQTSDTVEITL